MAFKHGVIAVPFGTAPVFLCTPGPSGVLLQNVGAVPVFFGGPGVTADTAATGGVPLGTGQTFPDSLVGRPSVTVPPDTDQGLYGRVASGTGSVGPAGRCAGRSPRHRHPVT
jgi:hypothetical protein